MQRVVRLGGQQPVGGHHTGHVGGFDGDDDILEIMLFQQTHMVQGALHHGLRHRRAVTGQNVLFQTASVDADADGHIFGVAGIRHRLDIFICANVAGVDADFVRAGIQRRQRSLVIKVNVRHNGDVNCLLDGRHHAGIRGGGHRHTDDLAACRRHTFGLSHVARYILHRNIQHGLHSNRIVATDGQIADFHFTFQLAHKAASFYKNLVISCMVTNSISHNSSAMPAVFSAFWMRWGTT